MVLLNAFIVPIEMVEQSLPNVLRFSHEDVKPGVVDDINAGGVRCGDFDGAFCKTISQPKRDLTPAIDHGSPKNHRCCSIDNCLRVTTASDTAPLLFPDLTVNSPFNLKRPQWSSLVLVRESY